MVGAPKRIRPYHALFTTPTLAAWRRQDGLVRKAATVHMPNRVQYRAQTNIPALCCLDAAARFQNLRTVQFDISAISPIFFAQPQTTVQRLTAQWLCPSANASSHLPSGGPNNCVGKRLPLFTAHGMGCNLATHRILVAKSDVLHQASPLPPTLDVAPVH